ncbi:MAG: Lrp/AsnC family transcriptional regulator [Pseudomonadota bacterium]
MTPLDRALINGLQGGFPVCDRPFADIAKQFGSDETTIISRIAALQQNGVISRFGPLYNTEMLGGAVTLAAIAVPEERFDEVADIVNGFDEVAHNYKRHDRLNMWFVILAQSQDALFDVIDQIRTASGLDVLNFPKEQEYFLELRLEVPDVQF